MEVLSLFDKAILAHIQKQKMISIKAGSGHHHFLEIWAVVVNDHVFIRSWALKKGWYQTFIQEGVGEIKIGGQIFPVQAEPVTDPVTLIEISKAYEAKYNGLFDRPYTKDMIASASVATTMELQPDN